MLKKHGTRNYISKSNMSFPNVSNYSLILQLATNVYVYIILQKISTLNSSKDKAKAKWT